MSTPVAIRFDEDLLDEVRRVARRRGTTVSSVVQSFTEEGVRAGQIPGIVFRDGPAGRRAGVAGSLDVWEIISAAQTEDKPIDTASLATEICVPLHAITIALDYYSRYPEEIDQWIADNDLEAERAETSWARKQAVLA